MCVCVCERERGSIVMYCTCIHMLCTSICITYHSLYGAYHNTFQYDEYAARQELVIVVKHTQGTQALHTAYVVHIYVYMSYALANTRQCMVVVYCFVVREKAINMSIE